MSETDKVKLHRFPWQLPAVGLSGVLLVLIGQAMYGAAIVLSLLRIPLFFAKDTAKVVAAILWWSGLPSSLGLLLILVDLLFLLPRKRRRLERRIESNGCNPSRLTIALTAFNDEQSIGTSVKDFLLHPLVTRVIVVDNNSSDRTAELAAEAGAQVIVETNPGYGACVYRCLTELLYQAETDYVVLCEGDMTFRARDLEKLVTFALHADIVNGTRIVEQLREYSTQLSTFMYYGNFFVGKLLEIKHLGRGTFTDVGTTYKLFRRDILPGLLPWLNPAVNLEFNAHFMDRALSAGYLIVECPVTFHPRAGVSKGGNVSNAKALRVGTRMIAGLLTDWKFFRNPGRAPVAMGQNVGNGRT